MCGSHDLNVGYKFEELVQGKEEEENQKGYAGHEEEELEENNELDLTGVVFILMRWHLLFPAAIIKACGLFEDDEKNEEQKK